MSKRKLVLANNPLLAGPGLEDRQKMGIPYRELRLSLIDRDPEQPRKTFDQDRLNELSDSIKTYGVLSPILVRPTVGGRYMVIAGERRLRAAEMAGLAVVPVLVDQEDTTGDRTMAMQLVENLQRADLAPLERAHAIGALKERYSLSVRDLGEKLGISKSMVQRSLDILNLPDDLLNALRQGAAESKVLLLAKIEDPKIRASYLKDLDVLTRGQIEKDLSKTESAEGKARELSPEDKRITDELQRALGLKVKLIRSTPEAENGRLVLDFYSTDDLQELFRRLVAAN